jgi:hypothetical protein
MGPISKVRKARDSIPDSGFWLTGERQSADFAKAILSRCTAAFGVDDGVIGKGVVRTDPLVSFEEASPISPGIWYRYSGGREIMTR